MQAVNKQVLLWMYSYWGDLLHGWIRTDVALHNPLRISRLGNSLFVLSKRVSTVAIWMRNGGIWMHMAAYECATDAFGCILRMHTPAITDNQTHILFCMVLAMGYAGGGGGSRFVPTFRFRA